VLEQVHDENLQSIQLLNQFMDEQHAFASSYHRHQERKRIFFSAYVPVRESHPKDEEQRELKRFRLDLGINIEDHMTRILRECGVVITPTEADARVASSTASASRPTSHDNTWDFDRERFRSSTAQGGMDYGFNAHFAQYAHTRRRPKRSILSLHEFFAFINDPETRQRQQHVRTAWESIQSVQRTLKREFRLSEVATSCGWASIPLNATLLSLLQTLRKLRHSINLTNVRLDVRAAASEIDYFDEYTVVLNVADVPLQWVQVLELVDADMLQAIHAAYESLHQLQTAAERALGGGITIRRGRTCSALAYRGFLQDMASTAPLFEHDPMRADSYGQDAVIEQLAIVVEDSARDCEVLDDGSVRAPSTVSASQVLDFVDTHRHEIREQVLDHNTEHEQFEFLSRQCIDALGLTSLTFAEGLRLRDVNRASAKLLSFVTDKSRYGSPSPATDSLQAVHGKALRFDRFFGLAQDGVFTLPTDWMDQKM
jgi:hypothetical protein